MRTPALRIGFSEIGMDTYWPQFADPKSRLKGCLTMADPTLACSGFEIINPSFMATSEKMPIGAVWDEYCRRQNVLVGPAWIQEVKAYEKSTLSLR
jgi:hypothetical protein